DLFDASTRARALGDRWYSMWEVRRAPQPHIDWLRLLVLEGIGDVLVACAGAHYLSVGEDALKVLGRIGHKLLPSVDPTDPGRLLAEADAADSSSDEELFGQLISIYEAAFDESLQFREYNLREKLLPQL